MSTNDEKRPGADGAANDGDIDAAELRRRVIYALLRPAVRLAAGASVPLAEVVELLQTAYFHEVRQDGARLDEAAEKLGVSRRTAARLSKQLKQRFVAPELAHSLPRRIEFMVAAEPMSRARVAQTLGGYEREEVEAAVERLLADGRLRETDERTPTLHAVTTLRQLARDTWVKRVGALGSFAENLADVAHGRFFAETPQAFARTLSFRMPPGGEEELEALYREHVLPRVVALDETEDGAAMQMSICWAPQDLARDAGGEGGDR